MNGTNSWLSSAGGHRKADESVCSELPMIGPTMTPRPMAASTKPVMTPTLSGKQLVAIAIIVDSTQAEATPLRKRMKESSAAAAAPETAKGTAANAASIRAEAKME